MINFVTLSRAVHRYTCEEELGDDEALLLQGLFYVYNDRMWPEEPMSISTNHLLYETNFVGSHRDDKLRAARAKLCDRGILTVTQGEAYKARAQYQVHWDIILRDYGPQLDRNPSETCTESGTESARNPHGNCAENRPYIINQNQDQNQTEDSVPVVLQESDTHSSSQQVSETRAREGWFDPEHPEQGDDGAWRFSRSARLATAQRIVNAVSNNLTPGVEVIDDCDTEVSADNAVNDLATAMECGVTPADIMTAARESWFMSEWIMDVRLKAVAKGKAPPSWLAIRHQMQSRLS